MCSAFKAFSIKHCVTVPNPHWYFSFYTLCSLGIDLSKGKKMKMEKEASRGRGGGSTHLKYQTENQVAETLRKKGFFK